MTGRQGVGGSSDPHAGAGGLEMTRNIIHSLQKLLRRLLAACTPAASISWMHALMFCSSRIIMMGVELTLATCFVVIDMCGY